MSNIRIDALRKQMQENNLDGFLVLVEENRRYLSGFVGEDHQFDESAGALIISQDHLILATDTRFDVQARTEAPLFEVEIYRTGLAKALPDLAKRLGLASLGFESVRLSVKQFDAVRAAFDDAGRTVSLVPCSDMVERLRLIKSRDEIEKTKRALDLAESVFKSVVATLQPGMTEKQVAWAMESGMREAGADSLSFPVIVAAGPNSALPHAIPTDRPIQEGEPILFDWGARLNGYCSDTSRTIIIGPPDNQFLAVYHTVLSAQKLAIEAIAHGASTKAVDAIARDHIHDNGYQGKFGHGLGHGTGLAVHEGPRLSPLKETTLETGMLVTVEPGIYLEQWGGVRIEHQVVVGSDGPEVLNNLSTAYDIDVISKG